MINISVLRKGAIKRQMLSTTKGHMLSICQIFESTDDVVNYTVIEINMTTFKHKDLYLSNMQGFDKWTNLELGEN